MNTEIEQHENNLYQFIDIAIRYNIEGLHKIRTKNNITFPVVDFHINNARQFFEAFKTALRKEIDMPENGRAFEIDIKDRFLPMINRYYQWYENHKEETKIFEPYNFYEWMYGVMVSTEHEINKYYVKQTIIPQQKEYDSLRRVHSFILAEAYHKGHSEIKGMSKRDFKDYVSELFKDAKKSNAIYQTVRSTYKNESNFLLLFEKMKKDHSKDYNYAMKIFKTYYPDLPEIKLK